MYKKIDIVSDIYVLDNIKSHFFIMNIQIWQFWFYYNLADR